MDDGREYRLPSAISPAGYFAGGVAGVGGAAGAGAGAGAGAVVPAAAGAGGTVPGSGLMNSSIT